MVEIIYYLPKLKKGLGIAFGAHLCHDFPIKIFLIQNSINLQSFNVDFQDIEQNVFLRSCLDK